MAPGGAGGSGLPLTDVAFVDAGTTATAHNGSIEEPFLTLQAAIDAGFLSMLVAPGTYAGAVAIAEADGHISIQSLDADPSSVTIGGAITLSDNAVMTLVDVTWTHIVDSATLPDFATINLSNAPGGTIQGNDGTVLNDIAEKSALLGACDALGTAFLRNVACVAAIGLTGTLQSFTSSFDGPISANALDFNGCVVGLAGIIGVSSFNAKASSFGAAVVSGDPTDRAEGCTFNSTSDFTGITLLNCIVNGALHSTGICVATDTNFNSGQLRIDGQATLTNCQNLAAASVALILGGAGTTNVLDNIVWAGITQFGDGTFRGSNLLFKAAVATTGAGILELANTRFTSVGATINSAHLYCDSFTERNMLGLPMGVLVTVHALDVNQGGDAIPITNGNTTVNFTAETRGFLGQQVLTANAQVQINTTGKIADNQVWIIDSYNRTGHILTVVDDVGATIGPVIGASPLNGDGRVVGVRYTYGINSVTHKAVIISIEKL